MVFWEVPQCCKKTDTEVSTALLVSIFSIVIDFIFHVNIDDKNIGLSKASVQM